MRYYLAQEEEEKVAAFNELNNIPKVATKYNRSFSIKEGVFVLPKYEAGGLKLPKDNSDFGKQKVPTIDWSKGMKERPLFTNNLQLFNNPMPQFVDQVFMDDLIVQGSTCVGFDCDNGESFGFDTQRLKENNLRIKFQDTSNSASFPSNDWQLSANDTGNGGANRFSIDDVTAGRTPFTIEASAPSHSLYVDNGGRIGIGTANPIVEAHVVNGDSPTLRLEQNSTSGFATQTWDIGSNETNFFIRDATNDSKLPFRIRPAAPQNSMYIDTDGEIGMGTQSPLNSLHILRSAAVGIRLHKEGGAAQIWDINGDDTGLKIIDVTDNLTAFTVKGNQQLQLNQYVSNAFLDSNPTAALTIDVDGNIITSPYSTGGGGVADVDWLKTDNGTPSTINDEIYTLGKVAIGGTTLEQALHVTGNVAISGSILPVSDARLKKKVKTIDGALSTIKKLRATAYHFRTDEFPDMKLLAGEQYGFIAQELEKVLPNLVTNSMNPDKEKAFKRVNYTGMIPFLVSGMQEQQIIIEQQQQEIEDLEAQVSEIKQLKIQMASLVKLVEKEVASSNEAVISTKEK